MLNSKLPFAHFMSYGDIKAYMQLRNVAVDLSGLDFYVHIEVVKPYDELTDTKRLLSVPDVKNSFVDQLNAHEFRVMECEVVTVLDEARYFQKINEAVTI